MSDRVLSMERPVWMRRWKSGLAAGIVLALLSCPGAPADGLKLGPADHRDNPYGKFPLWMGVPGDRFARLGEGALPTQLRWGVFASNPTRGKRGSKLPCITVAAITRNGLYNDPTVCGPPAPTADSPPVILEVEQSNTVHRGGPIVAEDVLGAMVRPSIVKLEVLFASGRRIVRRTKLLSTAQQRKTDLKSFRYLAFAMTGEGCATSVIGYGRAEQKVFGMPTENGC